ncbi:hypothetical protein GF337_17010 [candidate division KSB1 bacterium]|nr:hypothetical protein [candidate division KSB1 bacterium]
MKADNVLVKNIRIIVALFILIAVVFVIIGASSEEPTRMWQIYLINFLLWTGIAQAGAVFSAILELTNAEWGHRMQQVAESQISFLPASLTLLLIMIVGAEYIFPWVSQVSIPEQKALYLNLPFLFSRSIIGLGLLTILSFVFVKKRRKADDQGGGRPRKLAVVLLLTYALVYTVVSFDFIMSLSPHWYSTIMGMHFFTACFYTGLSLIIIMAVFGRTHIFPTDFMTERDFHDIGKLTFGFSIFWMSLLWSQYLVIWYGNIPEETEYLHLRFYEQPWSALTWTFILLAFILPFLILLNRKGKTTQLVIGIVGFLILIGSFVHMYVLVAPSLSPHHAYFGVPEIFISLGFLGMFVLTQDIWLKARPVQ